MSAKSKNLKIDRAFAEGVLERAREIAERYQIVIWFEDGEFYGRGVELPLVMADGKTAQACFASVREALTVAVGTMLENGQAAPLPTVDGSRTEQVNVRVSAEEKLVLESSAKRQGYRGLSDFIRTAALEKV